MSLADEIADTFPAGVSLPDEIRRALDWFESVGQVESRAGERAATMLPSGTSSINAVEFTWVDASAAEMWLGNPAAAEQLALFVRTGADGSLAGLWRDDDGGLHFVHLGSGSGSTMVGVLTDSAVDFLRFLAIGYEEPCWPESHSLTPREVHDEEADGDPDVPPFEDPVGFQQFVAETFSTTIPHTAAEIMPTMADMADDGPTDDPFLRWVRRVSTY